MNRRKPDRIGRIRRVRRFVGCVILESLTDAEPLAGLTPVVERVVDVPTDPDATTWHVRWYCLDESDLLERLPGLSAAMRPHWYGHFITGDDLCVILSRQAFWASVSDKSTWRDIIAYGDTVGVDRKWTEKIPKDPPAYVREALGQCM